MGSVLAESPPTRSMRDVELFPDCPFLVQHHDESTEFGA